MERRWDFEFDTFRPHGVVIIRTINTEIVEPKGVIEEGIGIFAGGGWESDVVRDRPS